MELIFLFSFFVSVIKLKRRVIQSITACRRQRVSLPTILKPVVLLLLPYALLIQAVEAAVDYGTILGDTEGGWRFCCVAKHHIVLGGHHVTIQREGRTRGTLARALGHRSPCKKQQTQSRPSITSLYSSVNDC